MHKKIMVTLLIVLLFPFFSTVIASESTIVSNNNYQIIIEDDAELLSREEEKLLKEKMAYLSEFGNVLFKTTIDEKNSNSLRYIKNYYYSILQNESGVAFYIDMNNREICVCATGGLDKIITNSKCNSITDNVYRYATKGKYYDCANVAFSQMNQLLSGQKIQESMKYICNAFLALMISAFTSFGVFLFASRNSQASDRELIEDCVISLDYTPIEVEKTGTHSEYSPIDTSYSSGGGGGGFSGGGRTGGGHSRRIFWKWGKSSFLIRKFLYMENIIKINLFKIHKNIEKINKKRYNHSNNI